MQLSRYGEIVQFNWNYLPKRYLYVKLDAFVVMPNHLHGIIFLTDEKTRNIREVGAVEIFYNSKMTFGKPAPTESIITKCHGLAEIVRGFKTFSARRIN